MLKAWIGAAAAIMLAIGTAYAGGGAQDTTQVPLPSTLVLLSVGAAGVAWWNLRRR